MIQNKIPSPVTDFIESKPRWMTFSILGGLAASLVGIHMYTNRYRDYYPAPHTLQRAWAEIDKVNESDQTRKMRHQYTDFGSFYRGPMRLAARLKVGIPKGKWEMTEKTVFQRVEAFFKPGAEKELTPFSRIKAARKELVDVAPTTEGGLAYRSGPEDLPGKRLTAKIEKDIKAVTMAKARVEPTRVPKPLDAAAESWVAAQRRYRERIPAEVSRNRRILVHMPIKSDTHAVLGVKPIQHTNHSPYRHNHLFGNVLR